MLGAVVPPVRPQSWCRASGFRLPRMPAFVASLQGVRWTGTGMCCYRVPAVLGLQVHSAQGVCRSGGVANGAISLQTLSTSASHAGGV